MRPWRSGRDVLVVEQEFLGVHQGPQDVLVGLLFVLGLATSARRPRPFRRPVAAANRPAGRSRESCPRASDCLSAANRAARPPAADSLPCTSAEFSRCRLCARLASCDRSHSQALVASGRPKTVRKYELNPLSGNCTARVPAAGRRSRSSTRSPGRARRAALRPSAASDSSARSSACR